jgi:ribosomal protein S27E
MVANDGGYGKPDDFYCCDCGRSLVETRNGKLKPKPKVKEVRND